MSGQVVGSYVSCRSGAGPVVIDGPFSDKTRPQWFVKIYAPWVQPYRVVFYDIYLTALAKGEDHFLHWLSDRLNANFRAGEPTHPHYVRCAGCDKLVHRAKSKQARSKSGLQFCSHRCQAKTANNSKLRTSETLAYQQWLADRVCLNDPVRSDLVTARACVVCSGPVPVSKRRDAKTCSEACRKRKRKHAENLDRRTSASTVLA